MITIKAKGILIDSFIVMYDNETVISKDAEELRDILIKITKEKFGSENNGYLTYDTIVDYEDTLYGYQLVHKYDIDTLARASDIFPGRLEILPLSNEYLKVILEDVIIVETYRASINYIRKEFVIQKDGIVDFVMELLKYLVI